ncbi:DUF2306 domain-containing protein [Inhella proteolytica]|uniref:DUF2306 domain-containing protein n=1 Tax=Inhella proteolytica TaxID=2795029 RepID=A0A931JAU3_9BURK|nr:DUF2306 domain-containing protein [Inhella proteolytica]MBH9579210.1 DUF2306 domain-containing protein [Inhella proteolytica]
MSHVFAAAAPPLSPPAGLPRRLLDVSAALWLALALGGQLLFAAYLVAAYLLPTLQGRLESWNLKLPKGYTPGDAWGNALVGLHLLFALLILVGGALQLLPPLRRARPALHRGIGRAYLIAAATLAVGGLLLVWTRPALGGLGQHLGISLNALLMLAFAGLAWRAARARRIEAHRAWALRLFLAVSGVWFFRLGLPLWLMWHGKPVGFDPKTFDGPFLTTLAFAQTLLPLAVFELLRAARRSARPAFHGAVALLLAALVLLTAAGLFGAFHMLWSPPL